MAKKGQNEPNEAGSIISQSKSFCCDQLRNSFRSINQDPPPKNHGLKLTDRFRKSQHRPVTVPNSHRLITTSMVIKSLQQLRSGWCGLLMINESLLLDLRTAASPTTPYAFSRYDQWTMSCTSWYPIQDLGCVPAFLVLVCGSFHHSQRY